MNGYRWRENGGPWISRNELEAVLGAWPGYIDALEDIFQQIQEMPICDLKNLPPVRNLLREQEGQLREQSPKSMVDITTNVSGPWPMSDIPN